MQSKQHTMEKPHSYSNRNKIYKGLCFGVEGFWAEDVEKSSIFLNSINWNCVKYRFISRGAEIFMR